MKKVLLLIAFFVVSCKNDEINHPNILFIMSDDHTSQSWGIYGGILKDYVKNDGIKRLAKSGVVLENLFCTNAICVPSRASVLTGQYSHVNGVYNLPDALDPDSLNVAKVLKNNGYQTSIVGKWHLKKEPSGFDYYKVLPGQGLYNDPYFKTKENWEDGSRGGEKEKGFSVVRDFCGHGISTTFHEPPNILHYGKKNIGMELRPGMTFTIEPMINAGNYDVKMLNDGWTAVTKDKSLSAQFEHTVGITENGYEIFTESAKGYSKPPYL